MKKYVLRLNVTAARVEALGLPFSSIEKNGVILTEVFNVEKQVNDKTFSCKVICKFLYHDEEGNVRTGSLEKKVFDELFMPAND